MTDIESIMDAQDQERRERLTGPGALLAAALWYAEAVRCPVFPLQPLSKHPLAGSHGLLDATTDPDQIRTWWEKQSDYNIGLATGHVFDVIDFDGPHAIALGYMHPTWWPATRGKVCTPRPGGNHWYVAVIPGATNKAGMVDIPGCDCAKPCAVDMRAAGGYVVAPPSRTDIGDYEWLAPLAAAS